MTDERIGRCEWCGCVDHHLIDGVCPGCGPKVQDHQADQYDGVALGEESNVGHVQSAWGDKRHA